MLFQEIYFIYKYVQQEHDKNGTIYVLVRTIAWILYRLLVNICRKRLVLYGVEVQCSRYATYPRKLRVYFRRRCFEDVCLKIAAIKTNN